MLSATLHAVVAALALLLSYSASQQDNEAPKIFELVAGEGDNYAAREAPALGTPGVKLQVPTAPKAEFAPPKPEPLPPAPVPVKSPQPEPTPVKPAPVQPTPKAAEQTVPNFSKKIRRDIIVADSKAKREIAKERAAEKKRQDEAKKQLSKEEFDRLNKAKSQPASGTKSSPTKVAKIDAEGIAKGVVGGSTKNKTGGAGGKALISNSDDVLGQYFALFKQRLLREFELPTGVSEMLRARVGFMSRPDGSISNARIVKSSGNRDFDRAVLDAMSRVTMPARPDRKTEETVFWFGLVEQDEK
ncbi:MAG: TonB family protein [Opitutaceae bacterium]|nr:TonB family protein [Opitutaceae bacterium]